MEWLGQFGRRLAMLFHRQQFDGDLEKRCACTANCGSEV